MSHLQVFRDLTGAGSRLGFYTKETRNRIPEVSGCYAWFLPLWFYNEELDQLLEAIGNILSYEPDPEKKVDAPFNWESVNLRVRRSTKAQSSDNKREVWQRIMQNDRATEALQRTFLEASLLMPPLYVGKAANLRRRYVQHTQGTHSEHNSFHRRFTKAIQNSPLKISVSDLLFVCIQAPDELRKILNTTDFEESNLNELIEQILMQLCRPPFSLK